MKNVTLFTKAAASLRQINIFKRLMMAFVVVIFLPMAIFGGFSVKNLAAQNNDGAVSSARTRLRNVDSALSERLRSINDISYKLYQDRNLHHLLCEDYRGDMIGEILSSAMRRNPHIQNIEIVNDKTQYPCVQKDNSPLIYIDDLSAFRLEESYSRAIAARGLPVWVNTNGQHSSYRLTKGKAFLGQYITHSRSILDENGQSLGVIIINISMDFFTGLLNENASLLDGSQVVLLGNKRLITYLNADRTGSMVPLSKGDTDVLLAEDHNGSIMDLDGKPYVVTKLSCTGAGWILADLAPRAQVQAGLYHLIRTLAAIIAVCTVLMVSNTL